MTCRVWEEDCFVMVSEFSPKTISGSFIFHSLVHLGLKGRAELYWSSTVDLVITLLFVRWKTQSLNWKRSVRG